MDPLTGRRMQGGGRKNRDFRGISRFISEITQDRAIDTMQCEYKKHPYPSFRMVPFSMTCVTSNPNFKVTIKTSNNSKVVQDRAILTITDQYGLSNGALYNDFERPLTEIFLTLNISETLRHADVLTVNTREEHTDALLKGVISNDLERS